MTDMTETVIENCNICGGDRNSFVRASYRGPGGRWYSVLEHDDGHPGMLRLQWFKCAAPVLVFTKGSERIEELLGRR